MAVTRPQDLTIAKNETAAEFMAAALWQLLNQATGDTPVMESALRIARTHVQEIVELHKLDAARLTPKPRTATADDWGTPATVSDEFANANGHGG
jgi:hypothetical protein